MTDDAPAKQPSDAEPDDDARRRFKEALERKRGGGGRSSVPHDPGRSVAPTGNVKRQRTFRRKSGG